MSNDLVVRIPDVAGEVKIEGTWLDKRDVLVERGTHYEVIGSQEAFEIAGGILKDVTKIINELEAIRKDLARPFNEAAKKIKVVGDEAKIPLEDTKTNLKAALSTYAEEQRRKAAEEQRQIEAAERERAEKAAAEQEQLKELGMVEEDEPDQVPVAPAVQPQVQAPRSSSARITERVAWETVDLENISEQYKSFDPKKLNGWLAMNKDIVKQKLKAGSDGTDIVAGIKFRINTDVSGR